MADQYVARFRMGTTNQRRAALIRLGKAGDPRAISLLQQITIGEPDPVLQIIALRAIHHLEGMALSEPASVSVKDKARPAALKLEPSAAIVIAAPLPKTTVNGRESAVGTKLDQGMELQREGQISGALMALTEAARSDPDILTHTDGANLAIPLTDLTREQDVSTVIAKSSAIESEKVATAKPTAFDVNALFDTLLETAVLLIVLIFVFVIIRIGSLSLANHVLTNLGAVYGQSGAGNSSSALAATLAQLTKGQPINSATLNRLEAQLQRGQFSADSPQFRATLLVALLKTFGQTQSTVPSPRSVVLDATINALHLLLFTACTILAIYVIGWMLRGKGSLVPFFRAMTHAFLITYGLVFAGLALWLLVLLVPTLSGALQAVCIGTGLLLVTLSGLYGFRVQINAASRVHQFGTTRGFIAVTVGSLLISIIFGLSDLNAIAHVLR